MNATDFDGMMNVPVQFPDGTYGTLVGHPSVEDTVPVKVFGEATPRVIEIASLIDEAATQGYLQVSL